MAARGVGDLVARDDTDTEAEALADEQVCRRPRKEWVEFDVISFAGLASGSLPLCSEDLEAVC